MTFLYGYIGALVTFLIIDLLWIGVIARQFYRDALFPLLRDDFLMIPAFMFYTVYIAVVTFILIMPAIDDSGNVKHMLISAALFGLAAYGTYDMTNYALLKDWPLNVTIVDIIWGMCVTTISSLGGYYAIKLLS